MIKSSLLACFLSACAAHGESYTLYVSPEFDDDYTRHIEEATHDWSGLVPVNFIIVHESCTDYRRTTACVIAAEQGYFGGQNGPKGALGYTSCAWDIDDACHIWLNVATGAGLQRQVAAHELGHAQGLLHEGPGTAHPTTGPVIMAPDTHDAAPRPTCLDAAAWYALRGWVVPVCPEIPDSSFSLD